MNQEKKTSKHFIMSGIMVILLIIIDQITKFLAVSHLKEQSAFEIWRNVFELHYLENQSAAFGVDFVSLIQSLFRFRIFVENPSLFLKTKMAMFAFLTVVVVVLLIVVFYKVPTNRRYRGLNLVLILFVSGAIGNLIDRVLLNYVVDFFYFKLINFPIFNVADIYVTVAAGLFIFLCIFYYKEEDFDFISLKKGE